MADEKARKSTTRKSSTTKASSSSKRTAATKKPAAKKPAAKTSAPKKKPAAKKPAAKASAAKKKPPAKKTATAKKPTTATRKTAASKASAKSKGTAARSSAPRRAANRPPVNIVAARDPDGKDQQTRQVEESKPSRSQNGGGQGVAGDLPTAPSLGPNTVIEREPVEERLARHDQSEVDAMGKDKRRAVVGNSYGPSFARQATLYGIAVVVVVLVAIGVKVLVDNVDTFPSKVPEQAPWSSSTAKQHPPKPIQ